MATFSVGDIVWVNPGAREVIGSDQPIAGLVTYVHEDGKLNMAVFGKNGDQWQKHGVMVWDGSGDAPDDQLLFAYAKGADLAAKKKTAPEKKPVAEEKPAEPQAKAHAAHKRH